MRTRLPKSYRAFLITADRRPGPRADQLELSLFGPGIGESIVVHFGDGQWMVVDSCLDRATRRPEALEYLEHLGVEVAQAVKRIVVTHWHDDHIAGISTIARAATSAEIVCSGALKKDEFKQFVAASKVALDPSGGSEFAELFNVLGERRPAAAPMETVGPKWAHSGRLLFEQVLSAGYAARVWSLSPSDGTVALAFHEIAELLPAAGATQRRAVALTPNRTSVVLWISVGGVGVLLGGDLEEGGGPLVGWRAILAADPRPDGRADIFKVAHHGSRNGHHDGIWTELLTAEPIAVVTPFAAGVSPLPGLADIERIKTRSKAAYCTGRPGGWAPPRRSSPVERTVREVARGRRVVRGPGGQVRLRIRPAHPGTAWQIELFGDAIQL